MAGIFRALIDHGHYVTVINPFPDTNRENYTEIDVFKDSFSLIQLSIDLAQTHFASYYDLIHNFNNQDRRSCKILYESNFSIITDSKSNIDVIFIELTASECASYLSFKLNIQLIYVTPYPL